MKKINKFLIYVLCVFAVIITVGFSNVKAANSELNEIYTETFESFESESTYNNTTEKIKGPQGKQWGFYGGCFSTTRSISGKVSFQTRSYEGVSKNSLEMKFDVQNVAEVSFSSKSRQSGNSIKVESSSDSGLTWALKNTFDLTTKKQTFTVSISPTSEILNTRLRFTMIYSSANATTKSEIYLDDVKFSEYSTVKKYSVSFESNGGTVIETQILNANEKVQRPANPTRQDYKFVDWFTTMEFTPGTEYNFETAVTADTKLYAKWNAESYLNFIKEKTHTSLNISYVPNTIEVNGVKYNKVVADKADWTGTYVILYEDGTDAYIFNGKDENLGNQLADINNNSIIIDSSYDDCKVEIAAMTGGYSIKTINGFISGTDGTNIINYNPDTPQLNTLTFEASGNVKIMSDNTYFTFNTTTGQLRFRYYDKQTQKGVYLYEMGEQATGTKTTYEISNVDLRFGLMFDAADYDKMIAEGAKFGISLTKDKGQEQFIECTPVRVNEKGIEDSQGKFYQFAVVLTNVPSTDYSISVTGKCYVEINGIKHMIKEKKSSVKLTASDYITASDTSAYTDHLGVLKFLTR